MQDFKSWMSVSAVRACRCRHRARFHSAVRASLQHDPYTDSTAEGVQVWDVPVPAPLASPLVLKCGFLQRQAYLFRSWKREIAVLTCDGILHLFDATYDFVTPEPALNALLTRYASLQVRSGASCPVVPSRARGMVRRTTTPPHAAATSPPTVSPPPAVAAHPTAVAAAAAAATSPAAKAHLRDAVARARAAEQPAASVCLRASKLHFASRVHENAFELEESVSSLLVFSTTRRWVSRANLGACSRTVFARCVCGTASIPWRTARCCCRCCAPSHHKTCWTGWAPSRRSSCEVYAGVHKSHTTPSCHAAPARAQ